MEIRLFVGYDPKESIAYHVFCQSVIERSCSPVQFIPLHLKGLKRFYEETHTDGSNAFIYSRFLIPFLCDFKGWAIWADGDMVCLEDITELWKLRDTSKAVQVVKHEYKTRHLRKYVGTEMESDNLDYPSKNHSSLMLINCGHYGWRQITPDAVEKMTGPELHRFTFLKSKHIGELPLKWNWLSQEYGERKSSLVHFTIGTPCFPHYKDTEMSEEWHNSYKSTIYPIDQPKGV